MTVVYRAGVRHDNWIRDDIIMIVRRARVCVCSNRDASVISYTRFTVFLGREIGPRTRRYRLARRGTNNE